MNSYYLSDDQLAVLASLLGANVVYGVESKLFSDWKYTSQPILLETTKRLEEKGVISIQYDGSVRMQSQLFDMLSILISPTDILSTTKTTFDGQKEVVYYYKKNHQIVQLRKGKKMHQFNLISKIELELNEPLDIDEVLTKKDLEIIDGYLDWFDEQGAMDYLKEHTKQPELVYAFLDKQYDEMVVQYYRWDNNEIIQKENVMVGEMNQKTFERVDLDENIHLIKGAKHFASILQMMNVG